MSALSEGGDFARAGDPESLDDGKDSMKKVLEEYQIEGFSRLLYTSNFVEGVQCLIQTAGLGAFQPNCVMCSWPSEEAWMNTAKAGFTARSHLIRLVQTAVVFDKVMLVAKGDSFPKLDERLSGSIDIWWIVGDGGIMLLLPFLLQKHRVWRDCRTRLFVLTEPTASDVAQLEAGLKQYVKDFRLHIEIFVKVLDNKRLPPATAEPVPAPALLQIPEQSPTSQPAESPAAQGSRFVGCERREREREREPPQPCHMPHSAPPFRRTHSQHRGSMPRNEGNAAAISATTATG